MLDFAQQDLVQLLVIGQFAEAINGFWVHAAE
jgi:hypothetical protein